MRAGKDRVLKKLAEEAGEVMLASKNDDPGEIVYETADLVVPLAMVLAHTGSAPGGAGRAGAEEAVGGDAWGANQRALQGGQTSWRTVERCGQRVQSPNLSG